MKLQDRRVRFTQNFNKKRNTILKNTSKIKLQLLSISTVLWCILQTQQPYEHSKKAAFHRPMRNTLYLLALDRSNTFLWTNLPPEHMCIYPHTYTHNLKINILDTEDQTLPDCSGNRFHKLCHVHAYGIVFHMPWKTMQLVKWHEEALL